MVAEAAAGQGRLVLMEGPAGIGKSGPARRGPRAGRHAGCACSPRARPSSSASSASASCASSSRPPSPRRRDVALAGAAALGRAALRRRPGRRPGRRRERRVVRRAARPLLAHAQPRGGAARCCSPSTTCTGATGRRCASSPTSRGGSTARPCSSPPRCAAASRGPTRRCWPRSSADPAVAPLRPGPLGAGAVEALVRAELGEDADPAFCAACHDATGGNPLLLRQLLRTLEAEGVAPGARATSRPSAPSARAPSPAPCCCGSRGCPPTPPPSRARSPSWARAPTCPRSPRWRASARPRWRRPPARSSTRRSCGPSRRSASSTRSSATPSTTSSRPPSARSSTSARPACCASTARPPSRSPRSC